MTILANSKSHLRSSVLSLRSQSLVPTSTASTPSSPQVKRGTPTASRYTSTKVSSSSIPARRSEHLNTTGQPSLTLARSASSDPSSMSPTNPSTPTSEPTPDTIPPAPSTTPLNWNEYLSLRRSRRRYNLVSSISTSACTTAAGLTVLNQNFESIGSFFGLDPMFTLGIATISSAGVGWLSGPILGSAVFNMLHRRVRGDMEEKEKVFYHRIKRHRVDPSSQSMSNPVPDYYGEKIGSVAEFRNWMKDQRAYNKKRQFL